MNGIGAPATADPNLALLQATQGQSSALANKIATAQASKDAAELERVEGAAQQFEAVFIAEMMKPMFEGLSTEAPFGGGKGEEIFRGFMLQEYGSMISKTGTIGIAEHVKAEMIRLQDAQQQKQQ